MALGLEKRTGARNEGGLESVSWDLDSTSRPLTQALRAACALNPSRMIESGPAINILTSLKNDIMILERPCKSEESEAELAERLHGLATPSRGQIYKFLRLTCMCKNK